MSDDVIALLTLAGIVIGYFLPLAIAIRRKHHQKLAIGAVNVLLGWTLLGWLFAFFWSLTAVRGDQAPTATAGTTTEVGA